MPKNRCREDFMKSNNIKSAESSFEKGKKAIYDKRSRIIEWERVATAVAILFLVILGVSLFFPTERLWGVNHLSYYPLWFSALIISLGFLAFIPLVNQGLQGFLRKSVVPLFSFLTEKRKRLGFFII